MSDEQRLRARVRELLVPGGKPLGRPGRSRSRTVRVLAGGVEAAQELFSRLEELGEPEKVAGYPGAFVNLGGGDRVGLRPDSRSGEPTMDVTIDYVPEIEKLKFEQP